MLSYAAKEWGHGTPCGIHTMCLLVTKVSLKSFKNERQPESLPVFPCLSSSILMLVDKKGHTLDILICFWSNQAQLKQTCFFYNDSFALHSCSVSCSFSKHMLPPLLLIGHCLDTNTDSDSHAEALYDPLHITISKAEVANLPKRHPTRWWQCITHCIRRWRRIDFASRQVRNEQRHSYH